MIESKAIRVQESILLYLQGFPLFLITDEIPDQDTLGIDSTDQIWRRSNIMLSGNLGSDVVVFISYNQLGKIATSTFSIKGNQLIATEWCIHASVNWQPLILMMACRLVGSKPLSDPVMECCLLILTLGTNFSEILSGIHTFSYIKFIWKYQRNDGRFVSASMC